MEFKDFIKIWAMLLVLIIIIVIGQVTAKDTAFAIMSCEDYVYKINLNVVPTNLYVYTMDDGIKQVFKTDYTTSNIFSTILHCGHKYQIIYESDGYQSYTEEFEVGKYIRIPLTKSVPLEGEVKLINLIENEVV